MLDKVAISRRLKVLRAERGWSQADLAEAAGVSINSIAKYEMTENGMSLESAAKIADAFHISIGDLAVRETPKEVTK